MNRRLCLALACVLVLALVLVWAVAAQRPAQKASASTLYLPLVSRPLCGQPLFVDRFDDPGSGWPTLTGEGAAYGYLDGEYVITATASASVVWVTAPVLAPTGDYCFEVVVRRPEGDGCYGVVFDVQDAQHYYVLTLNPGTLTYFLYAQNGALWRPLGSGSVPALRPGSGRNHVQIERRGARILVIINSQLLLETSDNAYHGGAVGLHAWKVLLGSGTAEARFDNLALCVLGGGGAARSKAATVGSATTPR
ncbi:MAG: hypothetical protein ACUVX9_00760 [Anaerolineae bacterium]